MLQAQLDGERQSFMAHWRDLGDYILPRRPRFTLQDVNKGDRRNQKIIDSTATLAVRTLRSGMMAGITSPARPWFKLTTPDPDMAEFGPVKSWLDIVTQRMTNVYLRSNVYNCLPTIYGDIGVFGTGALFMEEDFDNVVRFYPIPIGSYWIANDDTLRVRVFMREFMYTVRQVVMKFGKKDPITGKIKDWSNISDHVKTLWDRGQYEQWIVIRHIVHPNEEYDASKLLSKYKKYASCYYEAGVSTAGKNNYIGPKDDEKYLRESGYDNFPVLVPRWEVTGEDAWATSCPGMDSLGDVKALQTMHKRKAQAVELLVKPSMTGPSSLRNQKASILPGDITYVDVREGQQGFRPTHEVKPDVDKLLLDIQDHQHRISRAFYEDLFLMMAQSDRRDITAREIEERHEEKLLALGPVLEQLNQDMLDPMTDNTFDLMNAQGLIPTPPEELHGVDLKVEYVSIMAQAQKLVGIASIERFAGFVNQLQMANPNDISISDKIDRDQMIDVYGDRLSVDSSIVRSDDAVAEIRKNRADGEAMARKAELISQGASAAKQLSETDMTKDSALTRILQQAQAGQMVEATP